MFGKNKKQIIAIYPGRFQPVHAGHYSVFIWMCTKFGFQNTYITTSNTTDIDNYGKTYRTGSMKGQMKQVKSPYNFLEKQTLWNNFFNVPKDKVICCKNPAFEPSEIHISETASMVFAIGSKDFDRYKNEKNWIEYPENPENLLPHTQAKYYMLIPPQKDGISASYIRASIKNNPETIHDFYPSCVDAEKIILEKMRFI
jgi:hypothetical protein